MVCSGCEVPQGHEVLLTISRTGVLDSLKNVKKDVTEMRKGSECGVGFQGWEDFQEGDQIQSYDEKHEKRTLY
jgi:translation initiation factor IF-2